MDGKNPCGSGGALHFDTAPLKIVRAEKQYMTDNLGVQYLDCISNVAHVGHCHPHVVTAGKNQMSTLVTAQGFMNDSLNKYVKHLVSKLPEVLSVCYLVNSGSEANDLALRLARAYSKHTDVVVFEDAYHGNLGNLIDISPKMIKRLGGAKKEFLHVIPCPDTYRGTHTQGDAGEKYARAAEAVVGAALRSNRKVACFISEPIVVNCGIVVPPNDYYRRVYNVIRDAGGVCIADEVQTGLGRTGEYFWAFEHYNVIPDIVTVGKPLGNGHPIGAVITTREIADALGEYYSTFGGNPVACAIGSAVLDVIENEKLVQSARAVGKTLLETLQLLRLNHRNVGDVRGVGLCIAIEIVHHKDTRKPAPDLARCVIYKLKEEHHMLVQIQGPHQNVLTITPPMCFTQTNARALAHALDLVLSNLPTQGLVGLSNSISAAIRPRSVLLLEDLEGMNDEDDLEPEAKRQRTSYDDLD